MIFAGGFLISLLEYLPLKAWLLVEPVFFVVVVVVYYPAMLTATVLFLVGRHSERDVHGGVQSAGTRAVKS